MEIMKLSPILKDYIWGGTRLIDDFGFQTDLEKAAEGWMLSCRKEGQSVIENGSWQGRTLESVIQDCGKEQIVGTNSLKFPFFPVLIKLIDAKDDLSIQVHPDNDYAQRVEHEFGKTEIWYVMDAADNAHLIYGFKKEISSADFRSAIENNTLTDVLNIVPVKKGDLLFIEAGTVHAIGKGTLIAEIQQNSNATYRVYDYNRVGADGKPRELHIDKAVDVSVTKPPKYRIQPMGTTETSDGFSHTLLTECDLFTVDHYQIHSSLSLHTDHTSFHHVLVLDGNGTLGDLRLKKGDSFFVPANYGSYQIKGNAEIIVTKI